MLGHYGEIDDRFMIAEAATARFNCIGKVFGAKTMWIDPSEAQRILKDDGYEPVRGKARIGDVVIYWLEGVIVHAGFVNAVSRDGDVLVVQSKWGDLADFLHAPDSVPWYYGRGEVLRTDLPPSQRTQSVEVNAC